MAVVGFYLAWERRYAKHPQFVACPDFGRGKQKPKGGRPVWVLAERGCGVAARGAAGLAPPS